MSIFCNKCGRKNKDISGLCSRCGNKLPILSSDFHIKPEMILIHKGSFQMGSSDGNDDEKPVHSVTVDSFYMAKYPVTNREYKLFRLNHRGSWENPDYPVDTVSWYMAV